jgi:hypothetical protein
VRELGSIICHEAKWACLVGHHLRTEVLTKKAVDLLIIYNGGGRNDKKPDAVDPTIMNAFLPSYSKKAKKNFKEAMSIRDDLKIKKHKRSCKANGWNFVSAVVSSLGSVGHDPFWKVFDNAFKVSRTDEIRRKGTGRLSDQRKDQAMCRLHAITVRRNAMATTHLAYPPNGKVPVNPRAEHLQRTQEEQDNYSDQEDD